MPGTCSVDTSPLLYLYRIGQLTLLRRHYDRVLVLKRSSRYGGFIWYW